MIRNVTHFFLLLRLLAVCCLPATTQQNNKSSNPSKDTPLATKTNLQDGAKMIMIPAGPFLMGDDDVKENPRRTERTGSYYIYKYPVTVKQYMKFCSETFH